MQATFHKYNSSAVIVAVMLCTQAVDILLCFLDSAIGWASSISTPVKMKGERIITRFHLNGYRNFSYTTFQKNLTKVQNRTISIIWSVYWLSISYIPSLISESVFNGSCTSSLCPAHKQKQQSSDHRKLWLCFQWATCSWLTYFDDFERQVLAELPYVLLQVKHYHTMP